MIHVAFWVFAVCASIGVTAITSNWPSDPGKDEYRERVKKVLAGAIAFIGAMAFFFMIYSSLTMPRRY